MAKNLLIPLVALAGLLPLATQAQVNYGFANGSAYVTNCSSANGSIVIANVYNGYPVTGISANAFYNCTGLTSVTFGANIANVDADAFSGCTALTSVTMNVGLTNIGVDAFLNCQALPSVVIPNTVTTLGDGAFYSCFKLASVTLGTNVTSMGSYTFQNARALSSILIPASVTNIGAESFQIDSGSVLTSATFLGNAPTITTNQYGTNLFVNVAAGAKVYYHYGTSGWDATYGGLPTVAINNYNGLQFSLIGGTVTITNYIGSGGAVAIPNTIYGYPVTSIGDYAFQGSGLSSIAIPNSVTNIGDDAFNSCYNLQSIVIPDSVTSIGNGAFESTALMSITIPNSVTNIGAYTFYNCQYLTNVTMANGVASIGDYAFTECVDLKSIIIPDSVTSIGGEAFAGTALASVTIPNSVTSIGGAAFESTALTSITIPNSVTNIGDGAFYGCPSLKNITFLGNAPTLGGVNVFIADSVSATVYYYYGASDWGTSYGDLPTAPLTWMPPVGNACVQSGGFGFSFVSSNGLPVVIEASTDLVNWQSVWTNSTSNGFFNATNFTDLQWTNYPSRYYRAR